MWVGAKQVISQNKPSKSVRRRVLELESNPREGTGENFVTEGSRRAAGKGARESLQGWGGIGSGLAVGSSSRVSGPASPCRRAGHAGLRSLSGAAGRSWPQPRLRLGPPRARRARFHGPGPGDPSRLPRRPHQAPGAGTSAGAGGGGPAAGGDRNLVPQRRGLLPIPQRPGLFRGLQRRRQRRLLPDAPVGGGCREGREIPVWPGLESPALEAGGDGGDSERRAGSPGLGALAGARTAGGGGRRRWGPRDNRRRAHGFRFRFCLPSPGRVQRELALPLPRRLFGPPPL